MDNNTNAKEQSTTTNSNKNGTDNDILIELTDSQSQTSQSQISQISRTSSFSDSQTSTNVENTSLDNDKNKNKNKNVSKTNENIQIAEKDFVVNIQNNTKTKRKISRNEFKLLQNNVAKLSHNNRNNDKIINEVKKDVQGMKSDINTNTKLLQQLLNIIKNTNTNDGNKNHHNNNDNNATQKPNDKEEYDDDNKSENTNIDINTDDNDTSNVDINNPKLNKFINICKNIIAVEFINKVNADIYDTTNYDNTAKNLANKYSHFDLEHNVMNELNYIPSVPDQVLTQMMDNDAHSTDTIIDNDKSLIEIKNMRENAFNQMDDTLDRANKIINDNDSLNKMLKTVIDPKSNSHNSENVDKINYELSKLLSFNEEGRVMFDTAKINELPASDIIMTKNEKLTELFNDIQHILKYDYNKDIDKRPNDKIKNGFKILYKNIPRLTAINFANINKVIGDPTNRFLFYPKTDDELIKFAILVIITNEPENFKLHWDALNITVKQDLFLQTFRDIALKLNLKYNTLNEIQDINELSKATKQSRISELASRICNNRYIAGKHNKDKFWVFKRNIWKFFGNLLIKGKTMYRAIGSLLRDTCKFAYGKRLASRTNWSERTFQVVGDIEGKKKQKLCFEANNLKRAYEMKITENIITEKFKQITEMYYDLQTYITESEDLYVFCKALYDVNDVEYNINLLSLYKKSEIATINADQSTSKFRLKLMSTKRDLLKYMNILKHSNDKTAKEITKQIKNDIHILNIITCGEIRNDEEQIEKIKERLSNRFKSITEPLNKRNKYNNYHNTTNTNTNNHQNTNNTVNEPNNKRRKLNNHYDTNTTNNITESIPNNNQTHISEIMDSLFDDKIFNTNDPNKNQWRMKRIKDTISVFEKEDNINNQTGFTSANKNKNKRYRNDINDNRRYRLNNHYLNNNNNNHNNHNNNNNYQNRNGYNNYNKNKSNYNNNNVNFQRRTQNPRRYQY